jgi:pilus assembly protein CpaF
MNLQIYIQALGPLALLYNDPEVNEILVDAYDKVIVDRKGKLVDGKVKFTSPEALRAVIDDIFALGGVTLSLEQT